MDAEIRQVIEKEPTLLHEMNPPSPWQPERDPIALAVLGKFCEELGEATAIIARCIIQGIGESEPVTGEPNATAAEKEVADILATAHMVIEHFGLRRSLIERRTDRKIAHLTQWHRMLESPQSPSASGVPSSPAQETPDTKEHK